MRDTGNKGHGGINRGLAAGAIPGVAFGRYGQMFEGLPPATRLPDAALQAIAHSMIKADDGAAITEPEPADENPSIPAGYTYLGQFIDHDITFDPTPLNAAQIDVDAIVDFRSPALDLDNIFGRGPDDQPYMYDKGHLRTGDTSPGSADAVFGMKHDIARLADGTAILGDKRNDENKLVSQIHGAIIGFFNKVVDDTELLEQFSGPLDVSTAEIAPKMRFRAAAQLVRWHYQWIVVHDYLRRICMPGVVDDVLNVGGTPRLQNYLKQEATSAYMPIEFAGAAFRFGHSMIRPSYSLNSALTKLPGEKNATRIPTFSRAAGDVSNLNGFPGTIANGWGMDFGFFFDVPSGKNVKGFQLPQHSYRIDATLAQPLQDLPEFFKEIDPAMGKPPSILGNLAFRNLARGQSLSLPSGEDVAKRLGMEPVPPSKIWTLGSRLLTDPKKLPGTKADDFDKIDAARRSVSAAWVVDNGRLLQGNTPLWYYILREAEWFGVEAVPSDPGIGFGGQHLGPVGSRIVAETIIGLLWKDQSSFLHDLRGFRPLPAVTAGDTRYTFSSLIKFALGA